MTFTTFLEEKNTSVFIDFRVYVAGPDNVGAKWSILVGVGGEQLPGAQRELDTNLLGQARTAEENKQITKNYPESQI